MDTNSPDKCATCGVIGCKHLDIRRYVTIAAVGDDYYPDPQIGIDHAQECGFLGGEGSGSQLLLAKEVEDWAVKNGKKVYFRVYLTNFGPYETNEVSVDTYHMFFPEGGAEECFAHRLSDEQFQIYNAPTFCELGREEENLFFLWSD